MSEIHEICCLCSGGERVRRKSQAKVHRSVIDKDFKTMFFKKTRRLKTFWLQIVWLFISKCCFSSVLFFFYLLGFQFSINLFPVLMNSSFSKILSPDETYEDFIQKYFFNFFSQIKLFWIFLRKQDMRFWHSAWIRQISKFSRKVVFMFVCSRDFSRFILELNHYASINFSSSYNYTIGQYSVTIPCPYLSGEYFE